MRLTKKWVVRLVNELFIWYVGCQLARSWTKCPGVCMCVPYYVCLCVRVAVAVVVIAAAEAQIQFLAITNA